VANVRQVSGEPRRRWFTSARCDLIVWYATAAAPTGFQLCYRFDGSEKALTWGAPEQLTHLAVDDGEERPFRHKATPILVSDGAFDAPAVLRLFRAESGDLPADVVEIVVTRLVPPAEPQT
jgi:hypothetical protein